LLLYGLLLAGCENDTSGFSSEVTPGELPEGAIHFSTDAGMQTKSISDGDLMTEGWNSVDVSLDDDLQTPVAHVSVGISTKGTPVTGTSAPVGSLGILGYELTGGVWNATTATPNFMYNTQLIRTGSSGSYSYTYYPARYWPDDTNDKVRFFVYYPYNGNGISLSSASTTGYPTITYTPVTNVCNQVDLMYASTAAVNNKESSSAVNFALAHALTRVSFSVKLEAALQGTTTTVQSIEMTGLKSSGTLSLDPSAATPWTLGTGTTSYTASVSNGALFPIANQFFDTLTYKSAVTYTGSLLLLPQSVGSSNTAVINYTVDGVAKKSTYNLSDATWGMGQSLNYQVTLTEEPVVPPADPSNCHLIAPGASLVIPVGIKGEGGAVAGTGLPTTHTAASVGIIWQTSAGLITVGTFNAGKQTVAIDANTTGTTGNAVIAAYSGADKTGDILWSWHIWVTEYNPNTPSNGAVYTYNGRTWMDRNLGATTSTPALPTTFGLLYQWGRKDPFPASSSVSSNLEPTLYNALGTGSKSYIKKTQISVVNNLANSILNPATNYTPSNTPWDWYTNVSTGYNKALWGGDNRLAPSAKTIFDPCPAGWRVPAYINYISPWSVFTTTTFPWYNLSDWTVGYGRVYTAANTYYPAAGKRAFGNLADTGVSGYYGCATADGNINSWHLVLSNNSLYPSTVTSRAESESIRCIRN